MRRRLVLAASLLASACSALAAARHLNPQQPRSAENAASQTGSGQAGLGQTGSGQTGAMPTATQERLETETWWPTMSTAPLSAYTGSEGCTKCHADETASEPSAMQRASAPVAGSTFLASAPHSSVALAPYTYTLAGADLAVTRGTQAFTNRIGWDMGAGDLGHTFLYEQDGEWYQSQVSFYTHPGKLDTTTGFDTADETDLHGALGRKLTGQDARGCFGCHTVHATTSAGFNPAHAEPGLGCEACHGPGRQHAEAEAARSQAAPSQMKAAASPAGGAFRTAIFNPAALSPADSIDYCGACHRTSLDATMAAGPNSLGRASVRFQPYRLQESRCWRATGSEKLTCTSCHDPHQPLEQSAGKYDRICLSCHSVVAGNAAPHHVTAVSTAGKNSCVGCHMARVEVSSMHGAFTDHRIRIVRAGESYPN